MRRGSPLRALPRRAQVQCTKFTLVSSAVGAASQLTPVGQRGHQWAHHLNGRPKTKCENFAKVAVGRESASINPPKQKISSTRQPTQISGENSRNSGPRLHRVDQRRLVECDLLLHLWDSVCSVQASEMIEPPSAQHSSTRRSRDEGRNCQKPCYNFVHARSKL